MGVRFVGGMVILSDTPEALAAWYRDALGLPFLAQEEGTWYALLRTNEGAVHLGIGPRSLVPGHQPGSSFVITLRVDDLAHHVERLRRIGIEPRIQDSEDGRVAFVTDPDGNTLGLWSG